MNAGLTKRFAEVVRDAGISNLAELAREIGIKPSALYQIRDGKTKSLAAETAIGIAKRAGVRVEYLVLGELPKQRRALAAVAPPESLHSNSVGADTIAAVYTLIEDALAAADAHLLPEGRGHVFAAAYDLLVAGHNREVIAVTVQGLLRGFFCLPA